MMAFLAASAAAGRQPHAAGDFAQRASALASQTIRMPAGRHSDGRDATYISQNMREAPLILTALQRQSFRLLRMTGFLKWRVAVTRFKSTQFNTSKYRFLLFTRRHACPDTAQYDTGPAMPTLDTYVPAITPVPLTVRHQEPIFRPMPHDFYRMQP